jgi:ABC-2 type transport system permease protein
MIPALRARPGQIGLGWAFVERQINLYKRYWVWEVVWLVYGLVNTLTITFIAQEVGKQGYASAQETSDLALFLLIGTLVWAFLNAVIGDVSSVITWERWEGTIEHTLMAPVRRATHLVGVAFFGLLHAALRTLLIFLLSIPFFPVDFSRADWLAAGTVVLLGGVSIAGLAILAGVLPLLYPDRGEQMAMMVEAALLLVSGVYYDVAVLPPWLQALSALSPATYMLTGVRGAVIHGADLAALGGTLAMLGLFAVILVPAGILVFGIGERWAKHAGRLKRQG